MEIDLVIVQMPVAEPEADMEELPPVVGVPG
jgi:hypothetical protein